VARQCRTKEDLKVYRLKRESWGGRARTKICLCASGRLKRYTGEARHAALGGILEVECGIADDSIERCSF